MIRSSLRITTSQVHLKKCQAFAYIPNNKDVTRYFNNIYNKEVTEKLSKCYKKGFINQ